VEGDLINRAIAHSCAIFPTTVAAGLTWPLPEALDEDQLYRLLFPKPAPPSDRVIPIPDWNYITWSCAARASLCGSSTGNLTPKGGGEDRAAFANSIGCGPRGSTIPCA